MTHSPKDKAFDPTSLLSERTSRSKTKLDVLVAFLHERLQLHERSIRSLDMDAKRIRSMLISFEERREAGRLETTPLESTLIS